MLLLSAFMELIFWNLSITSLIIYLQEMWFGVLHHVCGDHSWAEGACRHSPEATETQGKTYLKKSSKALEALRKVVLDKKWLNNLEFYVRFRWVVNGLVELLLISVYHGKVLFSAGLLQGQLVLLCILKIIFMWYHYHGSTVSKLLTRYFETEESWTDLDQYSLTRR